MARRVGKETEGENGREGSCGGMKRREEGLKVGRRGMKEELLDGEKWGKDEVEVKSGEERGNELGDEGERMKYERNEVRREGMKGISNQDVSRM